MDKLKIELTKSQRKNLIEFFDLSFIQLVKDLDDVDNMEWLCDMTEIYRMVKGE